MDESIDIVDVNAKPTGRQALKSEAHKNGWPHLTVHIWLYTEEGEVLLQQRGKNKDSFPLLWDVSVAGHVGAGELVETAALREIFEEIGLSLVPSDLYKIGIFKEVHQHNDRFIDHEFHHCFLAKLKVPLKELIPQEEEVEALKLISVWQFQKELSSKSLSEQFVPHKKSYYEAVTTAILTRL